MNKFNILSRLFIKASCFKLLRLRQISCDYIKV